MIVDITWCSASIWYMIAAVMTYLVVHLIQVVLDLPLCEGQKVPDSPSDKHFELRKLVQRIIDEVTKLPEMLNHSGLPLRPEEHLPYFSPKKYEQLLATAVLNKVVEDYRNPKNFEDIGKKSEKPTLDAVPPTIAAVTTGSALTKDSLDINHNVSGTSSLNEVNIRQMSQHTEETHSQEDHLQRSLSESDESYLSDYIQKHTVPLPDLSDTNGSGSGPEDDLVSLKSINTEGTSWEENWLFRKRQLKTTESAIAMLVPSPTEDVKALIGDQIVDDVSDLSEADAEEDYDSDNNNNESGESNPTETTLDDAIQDSLISLNSLPSNEPTLSEAKNSLLLTETLIASSSSDVFLTDLISIGNNSGKVEAANATLVGEEINQIQKNNTEAVETDDVKLLQERFQNAPIQRDNEGNVVYPIGVARAINEDSQLTEYDRKEVPIEHTYNEHTHKYTNNEYIHQVEQSIAVDNTNTHTNQHISTPVDSLSNMPTTYPEIKKSASVKLNSENSIIALNPTQPLSPHPIAMTITEMFEQSVKPPLTSISEEEQKSNASVIIGSMQSNEQNINRNDINEQESKHSKTTTTPERLVVQDITNVLDGLDNEPSINLSNPQEEQELINSCIELDITHSVKDQSLFDSVQEHEEIKTGQQSKEIFFQPELQQGQLYSGIIEDEIKMKPNVNNSQFGKTDVKLSNKNQPSLINVIEESQIMLNDSMTIKPENLQFSRQNMIFKKEKLADQIITANELESLNETLTVDGTTRSSLKEQNTVSIHETKSPQEQIKQENSSQEGSTHLDEAGVSIDHHLETVFYTDNTNDLKNDITFSNSKAETNSSVVMDSPECISDEIACFDISANNRIIKNEPDLSVTNEDNEQNLDSSNITRIFEKKINHKTRVLEQQENQEIIKIMDGTEAFQVAATDDSNCLQDESQGMFDANMDTELIEKSTAVFPGDSTEKYYVHGPSSAENNFNYAFFNTIDDIEDTTEPSSPEDTSTEAIAGSIDRVSSPEEQDLKRDNAIPNELMEANSLQNTVTGYKSNSIYEIDNMLLNLGSEASSVQSTPIAVVTQQMRQYCEELKGILDARKTPDLSKHESDPKLENSENVDALEFFQEELCTLNEELEECELKKSSMFLRKDNLEKKAEIKSHILCNFDYVEEENIIAEDVGNLATENLEHITVCNVVEVSPSVEEHAVKDAVIIEYTASTEACATLINQNKIFSNVENILENAINKPEVSNDDELPPPPLEILEQFEEKQLSKTLSIDTQHALLTKSTSEDCISLYNSTTNQASITNESSELQKLGVPEKELTSLETDLSELSQILEPHPSPILVNDANDTNNEIDTSVNEHLIPGSIAERDILKWRNASPIPNNPYSPDILQKRLSESNRKFNLVDFDRLTNKDNDVPLETQPICEDDKAQVQNQSLQSELGGNQLHNQRYGRDYYINDAKYASGSRKLDTDSQTQVSHSTDDEKSLLLSQKQPSSLQNTSPVVSPSHRSNANLQTGVFPFIKSSSCGNVIPSNKTEDIFSAGRPVQVDPTDPILKKGTKLEYLSTPAHEVYLIPANEPIAAHSLDSLSELSMQSRADESLTLSEDSDITRIYEIGTGETKLILGDAIQNVKVPTTTPPPTPDEPLLGHVEVDSSDNRDVSESNLEYAVVSEEILEIIPQSSTHSSADPVPQDITPSSPTIDRSNLLKPRYVQVKQLSPDTIKFFSPKKPFTGSTSNLSTSAALSKSSCEIRELPIHTTNQMHSSLHIDFPANRNVPAHEFIIEKEVMDVLPSVKELAKCYSGNNQEINTALKPIIKPTDFIRQSSDMLHEDHESRSGMPQVANKNRRMYSSTNTINAAEEIREIRRLNLEAYNRPTFVPMAPGHSITARSLSKQIREELKTNATDDFKVHGGHTSPERPSSPVFAPGHLRNSIQFFENLKDK